MKEVSAVEWLVKQLNQKIDFIPLDKWDMIRDIVLQAKAMEKEQIKNAWLNSLTKGDFNSAEEYYNETFKQQEQ